jgi:hypothetical protein
MRNQVHQAPSRSNQDSVLGSNENFDKDRGKDFENNSEEEEEPNLDSKKDSKG